MTSFSLLSDNLISWAIQISALAALGVALPVLFRVRHPKTQLAFLHFILVVCILLPFIEPWRHPFLISNDTTRQVSHAVSGVPWLNYLAWIVAAGVFAKLCWLAGGLLQIRRYRSSATRVFPIPESIRQARMLTHADARFGMSRSVDGPATLGHVDPIILLPESFLTLDHEAQLSILCHELIHVRRSDWLVTLVEEVVGTVFWFSPAVWLLMSRIRLTREQLVDSEVIALTAAPEPYVQALLAMSGAQGKLKAIPAAFFLSDGHLPQRVRSLLKKQSGSILRLAVSYVLIACLLAVFTIGVAVWFPLIGEAYSIQTASRNHILPPTLVVRAKATIVTKTPSFSFNARVSTDRAEPENVMYSFSEVSSDAAGGVQAFLRPLPPLPPHLLHLFTIQAEPAVRLFHPGEVATSDDIARIKAALGESAVMEVMQAGDGTVQRVTILRRRFPDESGIGNFGFGIGSGGVISADAAGATVSGDGVH